jgi:hypothetical protein
MDTSIRPVYSIIATYKGNSGTGIEVLSSDGNEQSQQLSNEPQNTEYCIEVEGDEDVEGLIIANGILTKERVMPNRPEAVDLTNNDLRFCTGDRTEFDLRLRQISNTIQTIQIEFIKRSVSDISESNEKVSAALITLNRKVAEHTRKMDRFESAMDTIESAFNRLFGWLVP